MFVWKMKAPEKKPLVRRERPDETRAKVRRGSQKRHIAPIKALSEFHSDNGRVWAGRPSFHSSLAKESHFNNLPLSAHITPPNLH